LQKAKADDSLKSIHGDSVKPKALLKQVSNSDYKYGTVGCVALDMQGNLAAGTS